jgi:hypothetical protein
MSLPGEGLSKATGPRGVSVHAPRARPLVAATPRLRRNDYRAGRR